MDFKGATRLFADPDFDGEPVVIYEPKPGEPVVPPDNLLPPNTIGDLDSPYYGTPAGEPEDDEDGGTTGGGAGRTKYVLDDVNVRISVERSQYLDADGHLIKEDYRVLLKDDIKKSLQTQFGSRTDFLRRWSEAERKQAILDELKVQGVPLEVLQLAVANSKELDVFDLVAHIAFDQKPLTRRDRVNNAKKRDVFAKYGEQARTVLEVLFEKIAHHGIGDNEAPKVLELPPFDQIGTKTQIRRGIFGSTENYAQAVSDLEHTLYDELPFEKRA